jgi:dienelactone hydrolase
VGGLLLGGRWLVADGSLAAPSVGATTTTAVVPLAAPDPSQPGTYRVSTLSYGSGNDRHRDAYGKQVSVVTTPVDGAHFLDGWSALRTRYWGFGPSALPRNARVWMPEGDGPFPLVVFVHGNHTMEEPSEEGYAYLAELLASRGVIAVSVDENFLNDSSSADLVFFSGLREESDARGWLLLEHLALWRDWNATPGHRFFNKIDMTRIALAGHSRGGEAVVIAAAFNRLHHYPDDGAVAFHYDFGIKALIALAPMDGQYEPASRPAPIKDVSYLVLQGTHDMDVTSFLGERAYERASLGQGEFRFKAALVIDGANHSQFNTAWGRNDTDEPVRRLFNRAAVLPAADQRKIASVLVSAFVESTLRGAREYLPLFRDYRAGAAWLPSLAGRSHYLDTSTRIVSSYDEDVDLGTTTWPGGTQTAKGLTTWREQIVPTKLPAAVGAMATSGNAAAYIGWGPHPGDPPASYALHLGATPPSTTRDSVLVLSIADGRDDDDADDQAPIDLSIEVTDRAGITAAVPLHDHGSLRARETTSILKAPWMRGAMASHEALFQSFELPLAAFAAKNPAFDPAGLVDVRLVFDRTPEGLIVLDDVGLR